jgi:hypothetical protein
MDHPTLEPFIFGLQPLKPSLFLIEQLAQVACAFNLSHSHWSC